METEIRTETTHVESGDTDVVTVRETRGDDAVSSRPIEGAGTVTASRPGETRITIVEDDSG